MRHALPSCCLILALFAGCATDPEPAPPPGPELPFDRVVPRRYVCYRTDDAPVIDGKLDEAAWEAAPRTESFVDIEGPGRPAPSYVTRARMLWDERCFYIGAELDEPHLWATLTERDSVIFQDNDFEVFIDPDGDTHLYFELEINAFGTEWDLLLVKPYRDGGPAVHAWDLPGLRSAVHLDGTINDPSDIDGGWSLEIAIPWTAIREAAGREAPPASGDVWWVDFSRVEWRTEVRDGRHAKLIDPATGRPFPEHNWVWSPQGVINMHRPETWGMVMFSELPVGAGTSEFVPPADLEARFALRRVYEAQRLHLEQHGRYAESVAALGLADLELPGWSWPPLLAVTPSQYEVVLERNGGGVLQLTQDGRLRAVPR